MKIAICGKMRRGKSTVADYLVSNYGFVKVGFADKLKAVMQDLCPDLFANGVKPRIQLQRFGQVTKEVLGRDVWVNVALARIEYLTNEFMHSPYENYTAPKGVVLDDLRFVFEADALRKAGFKIIMIRGKNQTGDNRGARHESETGISKIKADLYIENDAGIPELYAKVDEIMRVLTL